MNYQSIYDQLIAKHKDSPRIKGKTHGHHIIPKSFAKLDGIEDINGSWNIVHLPHREHFIAHLLLARIWRGHKAKGSKMAVAFNGMSGNGKYTSKNYTWIKSTFNYSHSDETKRKMSIVHKGKTLSEDHKKKLSEANKGRTLSKEHVLKIREANKGRIVSEEQKRKQSIAMKNRTLQEEHKRKISESCKNKESISEKTRKKLRDSHSGKTQSDETKRKISEAMKGKARSDETKRKISEAMKKKV